VVVVTDRELQPPEGFRYVMWLPIAGGRASVVSIATLDPVYWGSRPSNRLATLHRRVSVACCVTIAADFLHFHRCSNPRCFLYRRVSALDSIDLMTHLGPEHGKETGEVSAPSAGDIAGAGKSSAALNRSGETPLVGKTSPDDGRR
jgi:hypothetical protein